MLFNCLPLLYLKQQIQGITQWKWIYITGPEIATDSGHQCDQKLGVGDQNFRTGCQQATNLLSHQHLKFQVQRAFLKENNKFLWAIVVQSNLSNTDTEGTEQSVSIREVSVLETSRRLRHF